MDWNTQYAINVDVREQLGGREWRRKLKMQAKHGTKYKDWQLTGPDGGGSRMPYAPEGASGTKSSQAHPHVYMHARAHTHTHIHLLYIICNKHIC
jgi:hypothetical protein